MKSESNADSSVSIAAKLDTIAALLIVQAEGKEKVDTILVRLRALGISNKVAGLVLNITENAVKLRFSKMKKKLGQLSTAAKP